MMAQKPPTSVRLPPETKAALVRAAAEDQRTVTVMVTRILEEWLTGHGYLEKQPVPPRRKASPKSG